MEENKIIEFIKENTLLNNCTVQNFGVHELKILLQKFIVLTNTTVNCKYCGSPHITVCDSCMCEYGEMTNNNGGGL